MDRKNRSFVVFMDVDGVLNTNTTVQRTPEGYHGVNAARVEILSKTIAMMGGGDIVLTSDWKNLDPRTRITNICFVRNPQKRDCICHACLFAKFVNFFVR